MSQIPTPDTVAEKIAFLEERAASGRAEAIELAALSRLALTRRDVERAWEWAWTKVCLYVAEELGCVLQQMNCLLGHH